MCSLPSLLPSCQLCLPLSRGILICIRPADFCMRATLLSPCCITLEKVGNRDSGDARFSRLSSIQLPLTQKASFSSVVGANAADSATHVNFRSHQVHHTAQSDSLQIKPQAGSALFLLIIKRRAGSCTQLLTG